MSEPSVTAGPGQRATQPLFVLLFLGWRGLPNSSLAQAGRSCVRRAPGLHRPIRILLPSATDGGQLTRKVPRAGFSSLRGRALQWPALPAPPALPALLREAPGRGWVAPLGRDWEGLTPLTPPPSASGRGPLWVQAAEKSPLRKIWGRVTKIQRNE